MLGTIIHPPSPQYFTAQVPLRSSAFLRHNCVLCVANAYLCRVGIIALHLRVYIAVVFLRFAFTWRVCLCDQAYNSCVLYITSYPALRSPLHLRHLNTIRDPLRPPPVIVQKPLRLASCPINPCDHSYFPFPIPSHSSKARAPTPSQVFAEVLPVESLY